MYQQIVIYGMASIATVPVVNIGVLAWRCWWWERHLGKHGEWDRQAPEGRMPSLTCILQDTSF